MLPGGCVTGDVITGTAVNGITLTTAGNSADLSVTGTGGIDVTEFNTITLTDVDTANGAISVTRAGRSRPLTCQSLTDADANDISLIATGGGALSSPPSMPGH